MAAAAHSGKINSNGLYKVIIGDNLLGTARQHISPMSLLKVSPQSSLNTSPSLSPSSEHSQESNGFSYPDSDLENIESTATQLARDYINYKVNGVTEMHSDIARTLRLVGDELMNNHQIVVNAVAKRLRYNNIKSKNEHVFQMVATEIYKDGNENWGRIVSLYVLGAILAINDLDETGGTNIEEIIHFVGKYIEEKKSAWINKNGGWNAFTKFFNKVHGDESKVWKGVLCLAGLSAIGYAATR